MSLGFGLWNRLNFTDFRGIMFHYKRARLKRLCPDQNYRNQKGDRIMKKIAVTYEDGMIFQHFGHTEQFKVVTLPELRLQIPPEAATAHWQECSLICRWIR